MSSVKLIAYAFALALLASPVAAQDVIEGKALALDGDTLAITQADGSKVTVRLWGVDAPEMKDWPWGPVARGALDKTLAITDGGVRCEARGKSHNRLVAQCFIKQQDSGRLGVDLGEFLIRLGVAMEWRSFSGGHYRDYEREALEMRRGVWKHLETITVK